MFQAEGGRSILWSRIVCDTLAINEQYHIFILIVISSTYTDQLMGTVLWLHTTTT